MADQAAAALVETARNITAAARVHKRAEAAHRRKALALMRKLDAVRHECKRLGIDLQITEAPSRRESE